MKHDFAQLYAQLGVRPDCTLEELKRAYRRKIAELHPDRHSPALAASEAGELLPDLISLYAAATSFHRQHGRLPGGTPERAAVVATPATRATRQMTVSQPTTPDDALAPIPFGRVLALAILLGALLLLQISWDQLMSKVQHEPARAPTGMPSPTAHDTAAPVPQSRPVAPNASLPVDSPKEAISTDPDR